MADSPVTQDPDAAREFREAYGFSGNAEQIIRAAQQGQTPELRRASRLSVNQEATDELSNEDAASAVDVEPGKVRDYAVKGDYVVVVYEDESGSLAKAAALTEGAEVELTANEKQEKAAAEQEAKVLAAGRAARAHEAEAMEEARVKANEESAETMAAASEEAAADAEEAQAEAEKAASESESGSSSARASGATSKSSSKS